MSFPDHCLLVPSHKNNAIPVLFSCWLSIQISRAAILKCQEAIEDQAVEKWNEKVQVMEQRVVKGNMIEEYLKYMKDKYPGMSVHY